MRIKKSCIIFLLYILSLSISAQIPNNGFENWSTLGNSMVPDGWWSSNDSINPFNTYFPITRSSDHYPMSIGSYSVRLENNPSFPDWSGRGVTWTGNWDGNNYPVFQVVGHPVVLYGYFKFLPQNLDTLNIHVRLYKNGNDVAGGVLKTGTSTTAWTSFSIPISNYLDADSGRILIAAWDVDQLGFNPQGNSILYIDNLSFDSLITPGFSELFEPKQLTVFPNPAASEISIFPELGIAEKSILQIYNSLGEEISSTQIFTTNRVNMNISDYPDGIYFFRLTRENGIIYNAKVVVSK